MFLKVIVSRIYYAKNAYITINTLDYDMNQSVPDLNQDVNGSENVICIKPFDPISIGDKGIVRLIIISTFPLVLGFS